MKSLCTHLLLTLIILSTGITCRHRYRPADPGRFENFITRQGDKLMDGEKEFRFIGVNMPGLVLPYDFAEYMPERMILPTAWEQEDGFKTLVQMNMGVVRLWNVLPQKTFQRIVMKYQGDKYIKSFSCWNQLLIMMYGQLSGCESLRELVSIITPHAPKSYHLGFGKSVITRSNLAKANTNRDCKIFEEFAYKMISIAQGKRITKEFEISGRFYAPLILLLLICVLTFSGGQFFVKPKVVSRYIPSMM